MLNSVEKQFEILDFLKVLIFFSCKLKWKPVHITQNEIENVESDKIIILLCDDYVELIIEDTVDIVSDDISTKKLGYYSQYYYFHIIIFILILKYHFDILKKKVF